MPPMPGNYDDHEYRSTTKLRRQLDAANIELTAWKDALGTSQLTHAVSRLEQAEKQSAAEHRRAEKAERERDEAMAACAVMRKICETAHKTLGAHRVPQTRADAAMQVMLQLGPLWESLDRVISQPNPGRHLLDEIERMRAIIGRMEPVKPRPMLPASQSLMQVVIDIRRDGRLVADCKKEIHGC